MAIKQLMQAMVMVNLSIEGRMLYYSVYTTQAHKVINPDTVSSLLVTLEDGQSLEFAYAGYREHHRGYVSATTELRFKLTEREASLLSGQAVSEVTLRHWHGAGQHAV